MAFRVLSERLKIAGPHDLSLQFLQPIPGTPFALRGGEKKEERLPGMRRWVDRDMIQRAMGAQGDGEGFDDYLASENRRNLVQKLLGGAGVGALSGHSAASSIGQSPLSSAIAGALLGAGVGGAWHLLSGDRREDDAAEAYLGAQGELARFPRPRSALPQNRQDESSAAAVPPALLHTGPSLVGGR